MPTINVQVYLTGTRFDFGKHKGSDIVDVPDGYLRWCLHEILDAPESFHKVVREELDRRKHEGVGSFDFDEEEDDSEWGYGCHL